MKYNRPSFSGCQYPDIFFVTDVTNTELNISPNREVEDLFKQAIVDSGLSSTRHFKTYMECHARMYDTAKDGMLTIDESVFYACKEEWTSYYQVINNSAYFILHNITEAQTQSVVSLFAKYLANI